MPKRPGSRQFVPRRLKHDDNTRDIACTAGAGKVIAAAKAKHRVIASVKDDWQTVFGD
jgi:hypothetical protein